jgi:hypothetical protein
LGMSGLWSIGLAVVEDVVAISGDWIRWYYMPAGAFGVMWDVEACEV